MAYKFIDRLCPFQYSVFAAVTTTRMRSIRPTNGITSLESDL